MSYLQQDCKHWYLINTNIMVLKRWCMLQKTFIPHRQMHTSTHTHTHIYNNFMGHFPDVSVSLATCLTSDSRRSLSCPLHSQHRNRWSFPLCMTGSVHGAFHLRPGWNRLLLTFDTTAADAIQLATNRPTWRAVATAARLHVQWWWWFLRQSEISQFPIAFPNLCIFQICTWPWNKPKLWFI